MRASEPCEPCESYKRAMQGRSYQRIICSHHFITGVELVQDIWFLSHDFFFNLLFFHSLKPPIARPSLECSDWVWLARYLFHLLYRWNEVPLKSKYIAKNEHVSVLTPNQSMMWILHEKKEAADLITTWFAISSLRPRMHSFQVVGRFPLALKSPSERKLHRSAVANDPSWITMKTNYSKG